MLTIYCTSIFETAIISALAIQNMISTFITLLRFISLYGRTAIPVEFLVKVKLSASGRMVTSRVEPPEYLLLFETNSMRAMVAP